MERVCQEIEELLTAYIDNELDEQGANRVEKHLAECPQCVAALQKERAVKSALREKYRLEPTPVHLRARIRRLVTEGARVPGFFELLKDAFALHKLKGVLTLVALVFFAAYPYIRDGFLDGRSPVWYTHKEAKVQPVEMTGEVVCVDCELLSIVGSPHGHEPDHRLGIRREDGRIWQILPAGKGKSLIHNEQLIKKRVRVEGYSLPEGPYLTVKEFSQI